MSALGIASIEAFAYRVLIETPIRVALIEDYRTCRRGIERTKFGSWTRLGAVNDYGGERRLQASQR
jgi:hypothetical protein